MYSNQKELFLFNLVNPLTNIDQVDFTTDGSHLKFREEDEERKKTNKTLNFMCVEKANNSDGWSVAQDIQFHQIERVNSTQL